MVIDTGIFITHLRARDKTTTLLSQLHHLPLLCASCVSVFELLAGATDATKLADAERVLAGVSLLPFQNSEAAEAAKIYRHLKSTGQLIEFRDIFIAATCIVYNLPLKTLNINHFNRIPGLTLA